MPVADEPSVRGMLVGLVLYEMPVVVPVAVVFVGGLMVTFTVRAAVFAEPVPWTWNESAVQSEAVCEYVTVTELGVPTPSVPRVGAAVCAVEVTTAPGLSMKSVVIGIELPLDWKLTEVPCVRENTESISAASMAPLAARNGAEKPMP